MTPVAISDTGSGPCLVFLHGAGVDADLWAPQVAAFSPDHRVICVTLPGHGASGPVRGGVPGMIALEFAARWPDRVSHLVMAEAVPYVTAGRAGRVVAGGFVGLVSAIGPALYRWLPTRMMGAETDAAGVYTKAAIARMRRADLRDVLRAALRYDGRPRLPEIGQPALVMVGEKNRQTHDRARAAAAAIPGAQFIMLEGAGHIANIDAAPAFNRALRQFVSGAHSKGARE